jgi:hypothetical protein
VLLLFRRTRHAGVVVGAVFHWWLAIHPRDGFYNFSSMLLAAFYLFAVDTIVARTGRASARWLPRISRAFLAIVALIVVAESSGLAARAGAPDPFLWLWVVYGVLLIGGFVAVIRARDAETPTRALFQLRPATAVLPILVVLNGVSPYVGLKTETSWAMFSNLRTEGGQSNHWLVPAGMQLFDYQQDLVELVEVSDPGLQAVARTGASIPYFELRVKPWMAVTYRQDGVERRFDAVTEDPRYREVPWVLRKLLAFRPVTPSARQGCVH